MLGTAVGSWGVERIGEGGMGNGEWAWIRSRLGQVNFQRMSSLMTCLCQVLYHVCDLSDVRQHVRAEIKKILVVREL